MDSNSFLNLMFQGDLAGVQSALREDPSLARGHDRLGWTPLHHAVARGDLDSAQMLLLAGAQVDAENRRKETALFFAVIQPAALVELLLRAGANPNHTNTLGDTPLFAAGDEDAWQQAELLLKHGAQVNLRNESGQTPLHASAASGSWQVTGLLLAHGAEVDARDSQGKTPLHWAVCGNVVPHRLEAYLKTVGALLDGCADGQAVTGQGESVAQLAGQKYGFPELTALLASRGITR